MAVLMQMGGYLFVVLSVAAIVTGIECLNTVCHDGPTPGARRGLVPIPVRRDRRAALLPPPRR
jgi:hypothetical protein